MQWGFWTMWCAKLGVPTLQQNGTPPDFPEPGVYGVARTDLPEKDFNYGSFVLVPDPGDPETTVTISELVDEDGLEIIVKTVRHLGADVDKLSRLADVVRAVGASSAGTAEEKNAALERELESIA